MEHKRKGRIRIRLCGVLMFFVIGLGFFFGSRFHWNMTLQAATLSESSKELQNPNRGFYYIYGFRIKDEAVDWEAEVTDRMENDADRELALIEINLQEYRNGAISDAGMNSMESLFEVLAKQGKQYIVRFLYDWDGQNAQYEPKNINIIIGHMKQVKPILRRYADDIFTLQGLFVGNWGEMNGTKYTDKASLNKLASTLAAVSDPDTYLAVRTPMQWRKITKKADVEAFLKGDSPYVCRLGLFNDGMLGNESDYGTYGTQTKAKAGIYKEWTRAEELDFQDKLCRTVPNGGEVIMDNPYNDLDRAIADFNRMHITYLNEDYDQKVLEKWSRTTVHTDDIFNGMDGLTYIKARLGYRLVLRECQMQQAFWKDKLYIRLDISNSGFAPIYKACDASLTFVPKTEDGKSYSIQVSHHLQELAGGSETDQISTIRASVPLSKLSRADYEVYFKLIDRASGKMIYFANEQDAEADGYKIGEIRQ